MMMSQVPTEQDAKKHAFCETALFLPVSTDLSRQFDFETGKHAVATTNCCAGSLPPRVMARRYAHIPQTQHLSNNMIAQSLQAGDVIIAPSFSGDMRLVVRKIEAISVQGQKDQAYRVFIKTQQKQQASTLRDTYFEASKHQIEILPKV
jgi:hypothetical protein